MTCKEKHLWLIDTLYRAKRLTLKEISHKWRDYVNGNIDKELPRSTFKRWVEAIKDEFNLYIDCDRSNYEYYITNLEIIEKDKLKKWILDTFATSNALTENMSLSDRILVEKIPSGNEFLTTIINAIKENKKIEIEYLQFGSDYSSSFPIEPYCLKLFENRWYVLGKNNWDEMKIYCLDRIVSVTTLDERFKLTSDFDAESYFMPYFGIIVDPTIKPQLIRIRAYGNQKYYLKTLPLHESQHIVEETEEFADFDYYMSPTLDLQYKLLSYGSTVEVIKPENLRNDMKSWIKEMSNMYKIKE